MIIGLLETLVLACRSPFLDGSGQLGVKTLTETKSSSKGPKFEAII